MVPTKSAYRILILILLLLGSPAAGTASLGPKAQVPETTYDFGEVFEDRKLTHTFAIKNIGDALLEGFGGAFPAFGGRSMNHNQGVGVGLTVWLRALHPSSH